MRSMRGGYFRMPWHDRLQRMRRSKATYKPALLLAALDLIDEGRASPGQVPLGPCADRFDALLLSAGFTDQPPGRGFMPIYHLSTSSTTDEPFWDLRRSDRPAGTFRPPSSLPSLLSAADTASFLPDLREPLRTAEGRALVRAAICDLLDRDDSPASAALLATCDPDIAEVDDLVDRMRARGLGAFALDDPDPARAMTVRETLLRDRALRRVVLPPYEHACALCETRIHWNHLFEAEAAHIKPRSAYGIDDPRNAISLCRTHHWAFDEGLWTAGEDSRVIVARAPREIPADLDVLEPYSGKRLLAPSDEGLRPHPEALGWHRTHRFRRQG